MNVQNQRKLKLFFSTVLFWVIASLIYHILRRIGVGGEMGVEIEAPISKLEGFQIAFIIGTITGVLYGILELLFEKQWLQRKSIGFQILIKTIAYTILVGAIIRIAVNFVNWEANIPTAITRSFIIESGAIFSILTFFILASSLHSFLRMVNKKFGPGILVHMVLGKYRKPSVEKKIFMFLDLKSSTKLAEQLGYHTYSRLIQQCFYDLNEIIQQYHGQIYQYVGDEAVICWDYDKGIKENACIDFFFDFKRKLYERKEYYTSEFGVLPEFKAGLHGGDLVVTEVGVVKKEIAYHGDVINTTARIQDQCNNLQKDLLISGELFDELNLHKTYLPTHLGEVFLKGKEIPVQLHSVDAIKVPS